MENKAELRARLRTQYQQSEGSGDMEIVRRVPEHPLYVSCKRLFVYVGVGHEIDTMPLIKTAVSHGKTVALPKSYGKGMMEFFRYTGELTEGLYHIPEPVGGEVLVPTEQDLMIVPGLAFDRQGYRLGQGAGYYDRYLAAHPCATIGLCRQEFFFEKIPAEWNDLPVNYVITENGASEGSPA